MDPQPTVPPEGTKSVRTGEDLALAESADEEGLDELPALEGTLEEVEPQRLVRTIRAVLERHSGPLPHPSILEGYKEVEPTSVQWILDRARSEQEHRHWCEREPLLQASRAQIFAFVLGILVVIVGALLIYADKPTQGFAAILIPLATLLGVFVYREIQQARSEHRGSSEESKTSE